MKKLKALVALLIVVFAITLTTSVYFGRRAKVAEAARSALAGQQANTRAEMVELQNRITAATAKQRSLRATANASSPAPAEPAAPVFRGISELLRDDPAFQAKWLRAKRAEIRTSYHPFFLKQKLEPDKIRTFEEIALNREEEIMDFDAAASIQGLKPGNPAYGEMWGQQLATYDANQKAVLGDSTFAQWKDYQRTLYVQDMISGYAGTAVLMGQPYTTQQIDRLVEAVANTSSHYQNGQDADLRSIDWSAADLAAQKILSPEQFALFTTTEPAGPTGGGARRHNQFWNLVAKAQRAEARETAAH